jgi:hypothetical protein
MKWKGPEHQELRLAVSLVCGVLSLIAAAAAFYTQSHAAAFAKMAFGMVWIVQAYTIHTDQQTNR